MSDANHQPPRPIDEDRTRFIDELRDGFVGRDGDMEVLQSLLASDKLINIVGPPGVGKSRLARVVVRSAGAHSVCDLGGVRKREEAERLLMDRLGIGTEPTEGAEAIRRRLGLALGEAEARVVLLDDADEVAQLDELLSSLVGDGASLTFVVTTRSHRHVKGVRHLPLSGLDVVAGRELFIASARQRSVAFQSNPETDAAIDQLVEIVDGLPLAIELAAARTMVMSPQDLVQRSASQLDVLKKSRATNPRHLSLRAALDSSWEQLNDDQRHCLTACAAFAHSFPLAGAEHVAGPVVGGPVADVVESLIEQSLLQTAFASDHVRFDMLGCIRDYATEQLDGFGWGAAARDRAREFLLSSAERLAADIEGQRGPTVFSQFNELREPYLDMLRDDVAAGRWRDAARLIVGLRWNILLRGPLRDYEPLLRATAGRPELDEDARGEVTAVLAEALVMRGERVEAAELARLALEDAPGAKPRVVMRLSRTLAMAMSQRDPDAGRARLEAALELARRRGDRFMEARLLERLGFLDVQGNDVDRAWIRFADARESLRAQGASLFLAESTTGLGYIELRRGQLQAALALFEDAVELQDAIDSPFHVAAARFNLGVAQHAVGRLSASRASLQSALRSWTVGGFRHYRPPGLVRLGLVHAEQGDVEAARAAFSEALQLGTDVGDHHNAAIAFCERAALDRAMGRPIDVDRLESMAAGILVGADPDAFASALTLFVAAAADAGRPTLPYVNRLEELVSLFSEDDTYVRTVVRRLRDLARAWHALALAAAEPDEGAGRQHIARAFEWAADLLGDDPVVDVSNPFVRLWARRLTAATDDMSDFAPAADRFRGVLHIHRDGAWYQLDGRPPIDLSTRRPLRLIMARLATVAAESPGRGLDVDALAEAGWPGEQLGLSTRRNRVYTAIRFLREMDLEELLVTGEDGYQFAADVAVRVVEQSLSGR